MADNSEQTLVSRRDELLANPKLTQAQLGELNTINQSLRNNYNYKYADAPNFKNSPKGLIVARGTSFNYGATEGSYLTNEERATGYKIEQGGFELTNAFGVVQNPQSTQSKITLSKEVNAPFVLGFEPVASTENGGYIYQGLTSGSKLQYSAVPKEIGTNIKSYSFNSTEKPVKTWVDKYNENILESTGTYDKKVTSDNGYIRAISRFAGINNNIISVKTGKTAIQNIQTLPKAEIIQNTYNFGKGAGKFTYEMASYVPDIAKGIYTKLETGGKKVAYASGLYGDIGVSNDGSRRKATISERVNLFATGNIEVASTLSLTSSSGLKLVSSKPVTTLFNAGQIGVFGYETYKTIKNPSAEQYGRLTASAVFGGFGVAGIYANTIKPAIIRKIVYREVPDTFLSPIAKAPQPEAYFKNVVFGDIRLDVKPAFDNPQGRTAKERYADVKNRIKMATTEAKVVNYLKTTKYYSDNPDLAGNTFIGTQNRQRITKRYVELTTSAQSGVTGNKVGGSPKSRAGIEEDILFMSAKGYGEPAFLRLQNTGTNSEGYSLVTSIFDYFRTPTLFNTKVAGVRNLPASVRYAKYEGIEKANKFYRSQANTGKIYGYNTLRSSASIGKGRPSIITVKQDYTFENGKILPKGTKMRMGGTKEDEIAIGSGQEFKLAKSRGFKGYLANKLFGSTTKRIELDLGGEKVPIPIQEAKLTNTKGTKPKFSINSKENTRRQTVKQMQEQINNASESYIKQRKSLPYGSYAFSKPSNISRVSTVSSTSSISRVSSVSQNSITSRVSNVSRPSYVSRYSNVSNTSNLSRLSGVSSTSSISRVSGISYTPSTSTPSRPIRQKLPTFKGKKNNISLPKGNFSRKFAYKTSLFAYTNKIKGKRSKSGELTGLGIRPL